MLPLLFIAAAFAGKKECPDSDIIVTGPIPAAPSAVYEYLLDLRHQQDLWPSHCARDWQHGDVHVGPGASAKLIYSAGGMNRKLTAVISKTDEDRRVTVDHAGNKGFITTWTLTPDDAGSQLELHTWINPPPWPFKKVYFGKVQGEWRRCHEQVVSKLDTVMKELAPPAAPGPAVGAPQVLSPPTEPDQGGLEGDGFEGDDVEQPVIRPQK